MSEKEYAKALLLNDEVIDVNLLPIGEAELVDIRELPATFNAYDPFYQQQQKMLVKMSVSFMGTAEELKGIHTAKKVSLIPR